MQGLRVAQQAALQAVAPMRLGEAAPWHCELRPLLFNAPVEPDPSNCFLVPVRSATSIPCSLELSTFVCCYGRWLATPSN